MTPEPIAIRDRAGRLYAFARVLEPRPACIGCVLEARATVPLNRTVVEGGEAIRQRMVERDLSVRDLARLGFAVGQVSLWINGQQAVSPESRPRLAAALEISQLELEAMLPRPGRRSREPGAEWRCNRHRPSESEAD
jgi:hypothetical protein